MNLKRHLNKIGVISGLFVMTFCVGFTSHGYISVIYPLFERSISYGNRPVLSKLQEPVSTATIAKPELFGNESVVAKLQGQTSTATNARPGIIESDKILTLLWYDTMDKSMVHLTTKAGFFLCKYSNCQYKVFLTKKDRHPTEPFEADAILTNGIRYLSPPPRRDENQVFVLAVRDSFYCSEDKPSTSSGKWLDLFNWTLTYRLDSDVVFKYANVLEKHNKKDVVYKDYDQIFEEKTNTAVWYVSHCRTNSRREHYVREMQNVVSIDIFGGCGRDPPKLCPKRSGHLVDCHENAAKKYKFYLAFENTFAEDYVTEKVFHWFNMDIIVVVRGGANYSRILPPGTVVDASDFETPIQLGQYLAELAQDKVRYIDYLKRKDLYFATDTLAPAHEANCKLCEYLNNLESHKNRYSNITEWWMQGWKNYDMQREDLEGWPRDV